MMLAAITPVFLIILLGILTRRSGWLSDGFFAGAEKFSFHIAFPALLFSATVKLDFQGWQAAQLAAGTLLPGLIIMALTLIGLRLAPKLPDPARSSVLQGALRPNSYFGLAVGSLLFPHELTSLLALALAICLPVVNLVAVVALSWWGGNRPGMGRVVWAILRNPIIVATLAGLLWGRLGLPLPAALGSTLDILGRAALCLGLLCVGAGLNFERHDARSLGGRNREGENRPRRAQFVPDSPPHSRCYGARSGCKLGRRGRFAARDFPAAQAPGSLALLLTSGLKLLLMPATALLLARSLALPDDITLLACFYCALPTAPNAYIMARQMGGDAPLMASLITVQTLLAIITVPLCLGWASGVP
ncbi:MAG: AEC family transporter [Lautropia sp.]|nr:AEC family transporter [Lautropia sp.]